MRKLKIIEHITLDGVIQHSADDGDFPYSDWTAPYRTPAGRDAVMAAHGERFDLLLGRRTYDIWSGFRTHAALFFDHFQLFFELFVGPLVIGKTV